MATIWFLKEGKIQTGPSAAEKPTQWCEKSLGLRPDNWIADLATHNLTIGEKSKTGSEPYRGYRFVVVEVKDEDLKNLTGNGWKAGFHLLEKNATEVRDILDGKYLSRDDL